jgi:regulator of RNase E activity RraB
MEFDLDINDFIVMVSIIMVVIINQDIMDKQVKLVFMVMEQVIY